MPLASLKRPLRRLVRPALRRVGLDVVRFDPRHVPELRRAALIEERGATIVLDVGANDGPFARDLRRAGYGGRIVSFEPQAAAFAALERAASSDPLWETRNLALGAADGETVLHLAANSSSSSLLEMAPLHVATAPESAYVGQEAVQVRRLDSLFDDLRLADVPSYLKLDVQGSELDVLRGAGRALRRAVLVEVELSFVPLYEGAPLFDEVLTFLGDEGFGVLSLEPVFVDPADGRLLQVDAILGRAARP